MDRGLIHRIKQQVSRIAASRGYVIVRTNRLGRPTMVGAIQAMAKRGQQFNTVIDIGASDGRWSFQMMPQFPNCQYLLIEAQPIHEPGLQQFVQKHPQAQYVLAAAGDTCGRIFFDATAPFGGQASYIPYPTNNIVVPLTTVDHEVEERHLAGPYLLKFDTHGFEVPILKGALRTLRETEAIIMECYNFQVSPDALLFYEMCDYLRRLGFRCIDLVDPMFRPYDGSFWQMDLVFIRDDRPEFAHPLYE